MTTMRLLLCLLVASLLACSENQTAKPQTAVVKGTISGRNTDIKSYPIEFQKAAMVGDDVVLQTDTADAEEFRFVVTLDTPGVYYVYCAGRSAEIFLHPGDSIEMTVDASDWRGTLLFDADGAKVNNYLAEVDRRKAVIAQSLSERNIFRMEPKSFTDHMDSLRDMQLALFEKRFPEAGDPSTEWHDFVHNEIAAARATRLLYYPLYRAMYTGRVDTALNAGLRNMRKDVTMKMDSALSSPAYREFVISYSEITMNNLTQLMPEDTPMAKAYRIFFDSMLVDPALSDRVRDVVLGDLVYNYITYVGVDKAKPLMEKFRNTDPHRSVLEPVEDIYAKWMTLARGTKAPDFAYYTPDGEKVALSDFKGSVVYVDVWATWCGPCIAEFPASKALKERFADRDDMVFLYVSLDQNETAWKKYLKDDPEFEGVHVTTWGWETDIVKDYMIDGIPRYILVDKAGRIVSASAPRPSSGDEIVDLLNSVLNEEVTGD